MSDNTVVEQLYRELVGSRIEPLIVKYDIISGDIECHPYRHDFKENVEEELVDVLFDNIVFYAYENSEIIGERNNGRLDNLRKAARVAYNGIQSRIPKTEKPKDGLLGELLLDAMLRTFYPQTKTIISRVKYIERVANKHGIKDNKVETHGYDALMFSDDNQEISVWLGQVKTGDWNYCLKSIKEDLNKSILKKYFSAQMAILADLKRGDDVSVMSAIINEINNICFDIDEDNDKSKTYEKIAQYFADKKINIVIPALLLFPKEKYIDCKEILKDITNKMQNSLSKIEIANNQDLNIKVMFLVFPVRNLDLLRQNLLRLRTNEKGVA